MTSSSSSSTPNFDVFLSNAKDTGKVLASRLYSTWLGKGISTYLSEDEPKKRSSSLKNIEGSKIAVVVVSQRYLYSFWCLNELQTILSLQDQCGLFVLPVYYKVEVSDIRRQSGAVAKPFKKLCGRNPGKVQAWEIALTNLANIPGLDLHDLDDEEEMVEAITTKVQAMLSDSDIASKVSELVGLDRHMKALYKLLDLNISEVRLIGIWGPGGVGKTTLARFAYEDLYNNFHTHMFIDNAENIYYQDPETSLSEETLTSGVQEGSQSKTKGQVSTTLIKSTVGHRNSLLVIDCVENLEQLKTVAEIVGFCGSGSRVILITQDKNLLDEFGVEHVYEVKCLRYNEALQLFSVSAFERECPPARFESFSLPDRKLPSLDS